jgi:hypothetical protein
MNAKKNARKTTLARAMRAFRPSRIGPATRGLAAAVGVVIVVLGLAQ